MYVLDGGTIDVLDWSLFDPTSEPGTARRLANPVYLIVHPAGTLIWDTGLGDDLVGMPDGRRIEDIAIFHVESGLEAQLDALGMDPRSITHLGLSHFHPDHVGNVGLFPGATLLAQHAEYEAAFGSEPERYGFVPATYEGLADNPLEELNGDHDVFGDGTVVVKSTPGHTPGHQSLYVRLPRTGDTVLSGDLAHSQDNWEGRIVPSLNYDEGQSRAAMDELRGLVEADDADLWIQHDLDRFDPAKRIPDFYG